MTSSYGVIFNIKNEIDGLIFLEGGVLLKQSEYSVLVWMFT